VLSDAGGDDPPRHSAGGCNSSITYCGLATFACRSKILERIRFLPGADLAETTPCGSRLFQVRQHQLQAHPCIAHHRCQSTSTVFADRRRGPMSMWMILALRRRKLARFPVTRSSKRAPTAISTSDSLHGVVGECACRAYPACYRALGVVSKEGRVRPGGSVSSIFDPHPRSPPPRTPPRP